MGANKPAEIRLVDYVDVVLNDDGTMTIYLRSEDDCVADIVDLMKQAGIHVNVRYESPCG
jgi:hypothetical protein